MADLYLHSRKLESIFELLGTNENDITYSIGWALAQSPAFLGAVLSKMFPGAAGLTAETIFLQEPANDGGCTDLEIVGPDVHVIIEAKRGWWVPGETQLRRYEPRLAKTEATHKLINVMAECSHEYAGMHLPQHVEHVPVSYLSWKDVHQLSHVSHASQAEKRLLAELRAYIERIVSMQDQDSNMVYVVAIATGNPPESSISWADVVNEKGRYFHPVGGNGWPKSPPNYIAFRYRGALQTIHHVDDWKIVDDVHHDILEIKEGEYANDFLYTLGPAIRPQRPVKTGKLYRSGRVWAMLDLLLTSETISEARDKTKKRLQAL